MAPEGVVDEAGTGTKTADEVPSTTVKDVENSTSVTAVALAVGCAAGDVAGA